MLQFKTKHDPEIKSFKSCYQDKPFERVISKSLILAVTLGIFRLELFFFVIL